MYRVEHKYSLPGASAPPAPAFLEKGARVAVYGAGNMGKEVCEILEHRGVRAEYFIDRKAQSGDEWRGVPIVRLDDDRTTAEDRRSVTVIVAAFNTDVDVSPIVEELNARGYARVIPFVDLHHHLSDVLGDRYWLTSRDYYDAHEDVIAEAFALWADETSRRLYADVLAFRRSGDYQLLPEPDKGTQYFPPDIPRWEAPLRFVDCGAFDGDTISGLLGGDRPAEALAAFEPDPVNFAKLAALVGRGSSAIPGGAYLFPCGVHSHSVQLKFAAAENAASHVTADGEATIQCVALDDVLHGFTPTLIKMDIEGAEYDALQGARRIIRDDRPGLAVCVYHRPEDIWRIPLLVRSWGCGYDFYLRSHGFHGFDLVMYAVHSS